MRTGRLLLAAAALLLPLAALATNAPHDPSTIQNSIGCEDCHTLHGSVGPTLTNQPDNFTECTNCHNNLGAAFGFGGRWYTSDQGAPAAGGHSHHWDSSTTSAAYGATPPTNAAVLARTTNGLLQCSACHDQHAASPTWAPNNRHVSVAIGSALAQSGGTASGATMTLTIGAGTPLPLGYRIRIGPATNQFQISHNAREAASYGTPTFPTTYTIAAPNTPIALSQAGDDPTLSVSFSAIPTAIGGYWDFYVGFPYMRMANGEGELCVNCHAVRNQLASDVESSASYGWASGKAFSHPVGQALGANGKGYDVATALDVNGATQGSAGRDANPTNDLVFSPTGKVTCVSCHAAHRADSNSQTIDAR